jgi:hypothetical protein
MTRRSLLLNAALAIIVIGVTSAMGFYAYNQWQARQTTSQSDPDAPKPAAAQDGVTPVRVSVEARKNMRLVSKALQPATYLARSTYPASLRIGQALVTEASLLPSPALSPKCTHIRDKRSRLMPRCPRYGW